MAVVKGDIVKASEYNDFINNKDFERVARVSLGGGVGIDRREKEGFFWIRSSGIENLRMTVSGDSGSGGIVTIYRVDFNSSGDPVETEIESFSQNNSSKNLRLLPGYYKYFIRAIRPIVAFGGASSAEVEAKPWQNDVKGREEVFNRVYTPGSVANEYITFDKLVGVEIEFPFVSGTGVEIVINVTNNDDGAIRFIRGFVTPERHSLITGVFPAGTLSIQTELVKADPGSSGFCNVKGYVYEPIRKYSDDLSVLLPPSPQAVSGGLSLIDANNGLFGDEELPGGLYGEPTI